MQSGAGEVFAKMRGRLRGDLRADEIPAVGDWVMIRPGAEAGHASIEGVLPRSSALFRESSGPTTEPQAVAANIDAVFITVPGDAAPNPRRVERQLAMVRDSGAAPVIVVTKADLVGADGSGTTWIDDVALGTAVVLVNGLTGSGVEALAPWLSPGSTLAVIGPSGAGKSTLANCLLGAETLATGEVRGDDRRGRHTTTWRELVQLPSGALLIDTPGVREVALWDATEGVAATFADVETVAEGCRFSNCSHGGEDGCAVVAALAEGLLDGARFASWQKLQRELHQQELRTDARKRNEERKKWSALAREARQRARP